MASSPSLPRFQCILTSNPEQSSEDPLLFEQEEGKKASFLLHLDEGAAGSEIPKPAHILLQGQNKETFVFGGLELVSNARNVEVYLTDQDGKETYLTTSRGLIVSGDDPYRFRIILVVPGGPRPVTRVHLKLLSLKPASCSGATLHLMKLKGRLPPSTAAAQNNDVATSRGSTIEASSNNPNPKSMPPPSSPGLSQADIGAAMAGVSMLVRGVEERILESVRGSLEVTEKRLHGRMDRIEEYLVMQQQQQNERFQQMQNDMMQQMKQQQTEMTSLITSLRQEVSELKQSESKRGSLSDESREVQPTRMQDDSEEPDVAVEGEASSVSLEGESMGEDEQPAEIDKVGLEDARVSKQVEGEAPVSLDERGRRGAEQAEAQGAASPDGDENEDTVEATLTGDPGHAIASSDTEGRTFTEIEEESPSDPQSTHDDSTCSEDRTAKHEPSGTVEQHGEEGKEAASADAQIEPAVDLAAKNARENDAVQGDVAEQTLTATESKDAAQSLEQKSCQERDEIAVSPDQGALDEQAHELEVEQDSLVKDSVADDDEKGSEQQNEEGGCTSQNESSPGGTSLAKRPVMETREDAVEIPDLLSN